jgi:hypothetical protein
MKNWKYRKTEPRGVSTLLWTKIFSHAERNFVCLLGNDCLLGAWPPSFTGWPVIAVPLGSAHLKNTHVHYLYDDVGGHLEVKVEGNILRWSKDGGQNLTNDAKKTISVTGRGGLYGSKTSRLPYLIANLLTDASEAVSLTRQTAALYAHEASWY